MQDDGAASCFSLCCIFCRSRALSLSLSPCPTLICNRILHWLFGVSALMPLAGCPVFLSISHPTYCNASALSIRSHPHDESFISQCQDAAETGCAPVARGWEQGVEEEEDMMLELHTTEERIHFNSYKELEMVKISLEIEWATTKKKRRSVKYDVIVPFWPSYALDSG